MAVAWRHLSEELIHHSGWGGQHSNRSTEAPRDQHHIQINRGSRGDCYDHSATESYVGSLERDQTPFLTYWARSKARLDISGYIGGGQKPRAPSFDARLSQSGRV